LHNQEGGLCMSGPQFEKDLGDLLRQTADAVPPSTDLISAVQRRVQRQPAQIHPGSTRRYSRLVVGLSAAVIVATIGGLLIHLHSLQLTSDQLSSQFLTPACVASAGADIYHSGTGTPTAQSGQDGLVGQVPPVTDQDITLHVTDANADAIGTTILVSISSPDYAMQLMLNNATILDPSITDVNGHTYSLIDTTYSYEQSFPEKAGGTFVFAPLSPHQLRQPMRFTFTAHHVIPVNGNSPGEPGKQVTGTWQSTFTVNPVAGSFHQLQSSSVAEQGVCMQPQSLEAAPTTLRDGFQHSGLRLILTVSGLPANTSLLSFYGWQPTSGTGVQCILASGSSCKDPIPLTRAILTLPGFTPLTQAPLPGSILLTTLPSPTAAQASSQTVGPTGTIQVELLYRGDGIPSGKSGTLVISNFNLLSMSGSQVTVKKTLPAWHLTVAFK
jgi:hypothetical protein